MSLSREEFACKGKNCCGGKVILDAIFFAMLSRARVMADVPFVIKSGYRCPKHNADVGSTSQNHVSGRAADIQVKDNYTRGRILFGLYRTGFTRIGIYKEKGFIHADSMDDVESCWLY